MKIIAIGDIHGRNTWKKIVDKTDADKIIFIGDYFDSKEGISPSQQKDNFKDIIDLKKAHPNKVVLLFGNHDYHYLKIISNGYALKDEYSGFQPLHKTDIQELLQKAINENLIQMCYVYGNLIFVHAGVTKTWCRNNNIDLFNLQQSINDAFKYKPSAFKFTSGEYRDAYGDDICQTPIWVRPRSLYMDKVDYYIQVVGHTTQDVIAGLNGSREIYSRGMMYKTSGVIFIDTLGTSGEYLQITNGKVEAKKIF